MKLDPQAADLYQRRGVEQFKLGRFKESIADFDKFIELRPDQERSHWQRGISYYYAGRFADGREAVRRLSDVRRQRRGERRLALPVHGPRRGHRASPRPRCLKIKQDPRVPMMQVYALYKGDLKPEDVLAAARAGEPDRAASSTRGCSTRTSIWGCITRSPAMRSWPASTSPKRPTTTRSAITCGT